MQLPSRARRARRRAEHLGRRAPVCQIDVGDARDQRGLAEESWEAHREMMIAVAEAVVVGSDRLPLPAQRPPASLAGQRAAAHGMHAVDEHVVDAGRRGQGIDIGAAIDDARGIEHHHVGEGALS